MNEKKKLLSKGQKKEMAKYFMMLKKISQEDKFDKPIYKDE